VGVQEALLGKPAVAPDEAKSLNVGALTRAKAGFFASNPQLPIILIVAEAEIQRVGCGERSEPHRSGKKSWKSRTMRFPLVIAS